MLQARWKDRCVYRVDGSPLFIRLHNAITVITSGWPKDFAGAKKFVPIRKHEYRPDKEGLTASLCWHNIPMMKAKLIRYDRITDELDNTTEIKMWSVPKSSDKPYGFKYSLGAALLRSLQNLLITIR